MERYWFMSYTVTRHGIPVAPSNSIVTEHPIAMLLRLTKHARSEARAEKYHILFYHELSADELELLRAEGIDLDNSKW